MLKLKKELRNRKLKVGGRKLELIKRLEVYEASELEARGNTEVHIAEVYRQ